MTTATRQMTVQPRRRGDTHVDAGPYDAKRVQDTISVFLHDARRGTPSVVHVVSGMLLADEVAEGTQIGRGRFEFTVRAADGPDLTEFRDLVLRSERRAYMDSNDSEIMRLREAVEEACSLLGVDREPIKAAARAWAEEKGYCL